MESRPSEPGSVTQAIPLPADSGGADRCDCDQGAHEGSMLADLASQPQPKRNRAKPRDEVEEVSCANSGHANDVAYEKERDRIPE